MRGKGEMFGRIDLNHLLSRFNLDSTFVPTLLPLFSYSESEYPQRWNRVGAEYNPSRNYHSSHHLSESVTSTIEARGIFERRS